MEQRNNSCPRLDQYKLGNEVHVTGTRLQPYTVHTDLLIDPVVDDANLA